MSNRSGSGDIALDRAKRGLRPITEATFAKVRMRFEDLQIAIAQHLGQ